ncbi:phage major capsid protein [Bradyrhizobium elkanii]|uniref:phage major capsid protein n=1 Tax=Bradyrhizobium elkanii TaxID=29448 RepID=UPI0004015567|nr:phage major capsid protein [Bradyrhizobium elkanii]
MPISPPHNGESQSAFMSRCVPEMIGEGADKRPQEQANIWRENKTAKQIDPEDYDDRSEFMSDCLEEIGDQDQCQLMWDERAAKGVVHKTHAETVNGMDFVLSDETPDRMDDIIMSDGWDLEHFKKNPIALFNHKSDFPIGKWKNLRVEGRALRGHLELAPAGTSPRIDEIRRLVEAGILRAVSVGFRPIQRRSRNEKDEHGFGGSIFTKSELVETSLVAVPANPNALAVAKSLKISPATIDLVFAGQGKGDGIKRRGLNGGQANRSYGSDGKGTTMSLAQQFSQRITAAESRLVDLRDKLTEHFANVDDENVSDEQLETARDLNARITQEERSLEQLRMSERNLALASNDGGRTVIHNNVTRSNDDDRSQQRPFSMPKKKLDPLDLLVRAGTVQLFSHLRHEPLDQVRRAIYGEDEMTRAVIDWATRAATAPAKTTVTGWAAELVGQINADFMELLQAKAIYPRLAGMGLGLTFGRNGRIIIPTRSRTPTVAGSFVGEGMPIPVRQAAFTAATLTPKKMAVITTWTREIDEHSVPAIEGLLRNAIQEDTAVSLDSVLLDTNPATTIRPAGILNGVAALPATAGGGFAALVGDIKQVSGALLTATMGNVRKPAWLMNPQQVMSAGLTAAPGVGAFPFQAQIAAGNLQGWPIIDSGTVPLGTVIAVDAADFCTVGGEGPRFEISDQATLHLEDTTPADIGTAGTPPVVAAPVKSMWQTDSLALRLILPINWTLRRSGVVAWVQGVTW